MRSPAAAFGKPAVVPDSVGLVPGVAPVERLTLVRRKAGRPAVARAVPAAPAFAAMFCRSMASMPIRNSLIFRSICFAIA
jgi:hypothetical protein